MTALDDVLGEVRRVAGERGRARAAAFRREAALAATPEDRARRHATPAYAAAVSALLAEDAIRSSTHRRLLLEVAGEVNVRG